jgi:ketosteroid isomerase-like protein
VTITRPTAGTSQGVLNRFIAATILRAPQALLRDDAEAAGTSRRLPPGGMRLSVGGAMSHANVDLVLTAYEFFARTGRYPLHLIDPEIEMVESDELPGDLSGRGHANLKRAEEVLLDAFDDWRNEVESAREVSGDRVLVFLQFVATGKGSGVEVVADMAHLATVRDRKIVRWEMYGDRAKALHAAGLHG